MSVVWRANIYSNTDGTKIYPLLAGKSRSSDIRRLLESSMKIFPLQVRNASGVMGIFFILSALRIKQLSPSDEEHQQLDD